MIALDNLPSLRRKVATLRQRRDEAVGRVKQIAARIKERHKVDTIEEGERLWKRMQKKRLKLARQYARELKRIETEFKEELDELDYWGKDND